MRRVVRSPVLWVLVLGAALIAVRPPLPIDETRYLEVFRESLEGNPLLLTLSGRPYAEKPPLLFWLGRAFVTCGLPPVVALRAVSTLASGLLVALVARFGRRLGLPIAAPLTAAMLLPFLVAQFLLFDTLLAAFVWLALDGWVRGRDRWVVAGAALALLTKGPVAVLFLSAFLWSFSPLRSAPRPRAARILVMLVLALAPLASWALSAAWLGGPDFAAALLWERWAGRVVRAAEHTRPWWFYAPVALVGALPATPVLLRSKPWDSPTWVRRTWIALLALLVAFTFISGKQAHYLTPLAPAVALVAAFGCTRHELGGALRWGLATELLLLAAASAFVLIQAPAHRNSFTHDGLLWIRSGNWGMWLWPGVLVCSLAAARLLARRLAPERDLATAFAAVSLAAIGLHASAGRLLYPAHLVRALASAPGAPLAFLGSSQHGFYELSSGRSRLEKLAGAEAIPPWLADHPEGLVLADAHDCPEPPPGTRLVARDRLHRTTVLVLARADGVASRTPPGPPPAGRDSPLASAARSERAAAR